MIINILGHLNRPNFEPHTLATVSPIPTDKTPASIGNNSKPTESVKSHGHGCNHNGNAQPANKYIGVNATRPESLWSRNTDTVSLRTLCNGGNSIILIVSKIANTANNRPLATYSKVHWYNNPGIKTKTIAKWKNFRVLVVDFFFWPIYHATLEPVKPSRPIAIVTINI